MENQKPVTNQSAVVADMSDKIKLGVYARYLSWTRYLLSQALFPEGQKQDSKGEYVEAMLGYLKRESEKSFLESQKPEPSFAAVAFHHDQNVPPQERVAQIQNEMYYVSHAKHMLKVLLQHDQISENKNEITDTSPAPQPEELNLQAGAALEQVNMMPVTEGEFADEQPASAKRSFHAYNAKNVQSAINGLELCQFIMSDTLSQTENGNKFVAKAKKRSKSPRQQQKEVNLVTTLIGVIKPTEEKKKEFRAQVFTMIKDSNGKDLSRIRNFPDSDNKKSIHPKKELAVS